MKAKPKAVWAVVCENGAPMVWNGIGQSWRTEAQAQRAAIYTHCGRGCADHRIVRYRPDERPSAEKESE